MKPDKKQIIVAVVVVSGLAAAGFWQAQPPASSNLPVTTASQTAIQPHASNALPRVTRTTPPGVGGMAISGGPNETSFALKRTGLPIPETATHEGTTTAPAGSRHADQPASEESADHVVPSGFHRKTFGTARGSETDTSSPEAPAFRAMTSANAALSASGSPGNAAPVVLEFAENQQLPAVLVAEEATAAPDERQVSIAAMASKIAQEFAASVTAPSVPVAAQALAEAAAPPATAAGGNPHGALSEIGPTASDPVSQEQRWDAAANLADEQYRLLIGQDEYQRKAIQAAILKRGQSTTIP